MILNQNTQSIVELYYTNKTALELKQLVDIIDNFIYNFCCQHQQRITRIAQAIDLQDYLQVVTFTINCKSI